MKTLAQKNVLLTGAAGGIGVFIARALAKEKATVICLGRSHDSLQALQSELVEQGGRAISLPFDLQDVAAIPTLIQDLEQVVGSVDVLINNAAIEKFRPFQNYSLNDIQSMSATNLIAPIALGRSLLPGMLARGEGHIVNISSGAGKRGAPFNSIYSATKAGLINWSDALRLELSDTPVNVSIVCPGITDAGMFHALEMPAPESMKITSPAEVADVVIQAILNNQPEVVLDGLTNKVFAALCQMSPQLGDRILHKVGIVENNRNCAQRLLQKEKKSPAASLEQSPKESQPTLATADR